MLRRLDLKSPYRSLGEGFWPADVPLGKRTIIYGHNGSGKSTLSALLLEMAQGASPVEANWEDETRQSRRVAAGGACPSPSMAVFTRAWVDKNLTEFLDGKSASAIVTLGQEAIGAKEDEERLAREIEGHGKQIKDAEAKEAELRRKVDGLAREVQDAIESQLRSFDYQRFSRNRWSMPTVKAKLTGYRGGYPDLTAHAEALKRIGEGALDPVAEVPEQPESVEVVVARLADLVAETPTRVALPELNEHPEAQSWVEEGTRLHRELDQCFFCGGQLTPERLKQLAQHFDQSWQDIRRRADRLATEIRDAREQLSRWLTSLPDEHALASRLRTAYRNQADEIADEVAKRLVLLQQIEDVAAAKSTDPSTVPALPDWTLLKAPLETAALIGAVSEHNEEAAKHSEVMEANVNTILDHLIGSKAEAFRDLEKQHADAGAHARTASETLRLATRTLDEVRQKQFSSSIMAEKLTNDLARVYGKKHLSVSVTSDGKSYSCRRGDEPAEHLSEGERTTLSLLYFLRKLEDETVQTDPGSRIVVVDDPSSSLDREALFATHQWLIDTLHGFGQFVVLTHDFALLRLFVKSQGSKWNESLKKLKEGDAAEAAFPRVAFLEMYAATAGNDRATRIEKLPTMLRNNVSEYAYLFSMVMKGVADATDGERLFLLPNAARRVLEVFCTYKSPHLPNFDQQLRSLIVEESAPEAYRDVYDFCNRYSHGEGSESSDVLDARTVHQQIRRCMEFLKQVDPEHFERMCKAVAVASDHPLVG